MLWDKKTKTIVNNESSEIVEMFNSSFNAFATNPSLDLFPADKAAEMDSINEWVYSAINNGVYRCGFATKQAPYEQAFNELFAALDRVESILEGSPFLVGDTLTIADIRLFVTLVRFDQVCPLCHAGGDSLTAAGHALRTPSHQSHAKFAGIATCPRGLGDSGFVRQPASEWPARGATTSRQHHGRSSSHRRRQHGAAGQLQGIRNSLTRTAGEGGAVQVYVVYFKTNKKFIREYPKMFDYVKRIASMPEVKSTINMYHIKTHYFTSHAKLNYYGVVPVGSPDPW